MPKATGQRCVIALVPQYFQPKCRIAFDNQTNQLSNLFGGFHGALVKSETVLALNFNRRRFLYPLKSNSQNFIIANIVTLVLVAAVIAMKLRWG